MKVIWIPEAIQEREDIYTYIESDNPKAAGRMDILFAKSAARLIDFPYMGKPGQLPGTRELFPHKHYRLVYEVDTGADTVWILALLHGARQWPPDA